MNIQVLFSLNNYTVIKDNITKHIWLYSYCKPICYFDSDTKKLMYTKELTTQANKLHKSKFKKWLQEKLFLI